MGGDVMQANWPDAIALASFFFSVAWVLVTLIKKNDRDD
jgi:hypothetical protein